REAGSLVGRGRHGGKPADERCRRKRAEDPSEPCSRYRRTLYLHVCISLFTGSSTTRAHTARNPPARGDAERTSARETLQLYETSTDASQWNTLLHRCWNPVDRIAIRA